MPPAAADVVRAIDMAKQAGHPEVRDTLSVSCMGDVRLDNRRCAYGWMDGWMDGCVVYMYMRVCVCACMCVCVCVCVCVCACVCMYG